MYSLPLNPTSELLAGIIEGIAASSLAMLIYGIMEIVDHSDPYI
jgi:hypothetical protein